MSVAARARLGNQAGMTLVELLVAMVIGLGVTLAVTTLLVAAENHKRTTTSTNDADQTGSYAFNSLDRVLRGSGSAFAQSAVLPGTGLLGCRLNAAGILPRAAAFPAPFNAFLGGAPSNLRVAPVLIGWNQSPDGTSDVILTMGGSGVAGGVSRQVTGTGGGNAVTLDNTVGFSNADLLLISQNAYPDCLVEQVSGITASTLTLGATSTYYTSGATTPLSTFTGSTSSYVTPLGNAAINNLQFLLFGVDTNHTLYSYDLLQNQNLVQSPGTADVAQPISDGVYQLHAIYGIDTTGTGVQGGWAGPNDAGYDIGTVMTTAATMKKIVSMRVSLLIRGQYYDKNPVAPAQIVLFNGLKSINNNALSQTVAISATDQHYRYRLFEFTVPLRNMILLAGGP
jgi:type IV pilus assembly protein PilW